MHQHRCRYQNHGVVRVRYVAFLPVDGGLDRRALLLASHRSAFHGKTRHRKLWNTHTRTRQTCTSCKRCCPRTSYSNHGTHWQGQARHVLQEGERGDVRGRGTVLCHAREWCSFHVGQKLLLIYLCTGQLRVPGTEYQNSNATLALAGNTSCILVVRIPLQCSRTQPLMHWRAFLRQAPVRNSTMF